VVEELELGAYHRMDVMVVDMKVQRVPQIPVHKIVVGELLARRRLVVEHLAESRLAVEGLLVAQNRAAVAILELRMMVVGVLLV
jgi:hypothetical protein